LLRRCLGESDFAAKVLKKFRLQSTQVLQDLVQACNARDGELTMRTAHNLKGMAATVSAESLRQAAAVAEANALAGDWEALHGQLEALRGELDGCLDFIPKAFKASEPAEDMLPALAGT
jgi:HPt (histidine-containing phosphotransfer) domain-containing protein